VILLDTCAIIWDALDPGRLSPAAAAAIGGAEGELVICDISLWEIAMLIRKQRLVVAESASGFIRLALQARNYHVQEITPDIAELSTELDPGVSPDPADRLIAATAILMNAPLVTADERLRRARGLRTVW
jgi:PIN domain nuclease of toxin-antitoxin system